MTMISMARRLMIAALLVVTAFAAAPSHAQDIPDPALQEALIKDALITFNGANLTGDYDVFHKRTATAFQQTFTPAQIADMFKEFSSQKIDLFTIAGMDPVPDAETKIVDGVLTMQGHFATSPSQVRYELEMIVEDQAWRLVGINVNVGE